MTDLDLFTLGLATTVLLIGLFMYLRTRLTLSRIYREGAPLVEDGWNTFRHEPEYEDIYVDLRNEAFGRFCRLSLCGVLGVALAFGIDVKHDVFAFLMDTQ